MKEEYRSIDGHPGYEVSNYGNIKSYKRDPNGVIRKPGRHNKGYLKIGFYEKGKYINYFIHRLVLSTFIGPPPADRPQTRHLDGDPTNNKLSNLRWASQAENEDDKRYVGTYHLRANCYGNISRTSS